MFCIMKGNEREFDPLVKSRVTRVCKLGAVDQREREERGRAGRRPGAQQGAGPRAVEAENFTYNTSCHLHKSPVRLALSLIPFTQGETGHSRYNCLVLVGAECPSLDSKLINCS